MGIVVVILEAIAELAGPAAAMFRSIFTAQKDFHANSDATPDELAQQAIDLAQAAIALYGDARNQIMNVRDHLMASHSDLPATIATMHAAAAVHHVAGSKEVG
jgi:hypothetical protein